MRKSEEKKKVKHSIGQTELWKKERKFRNYNLRFLRFANQIGQAKISGKQWRDKAKQKGNSSDKKIDEVGQLPPTWNTVFFSYFLSFTRCSVTQECEGRWKRIQWGSFHLFVVLCLTTFCISFSQLFRYRVGPSVVYLVRWHKITLKICITGQFQ